MVESLRQICRGLWERNLHLARVCRVRKYCIIHARIISQRRYVRSGATRNTPSSRYFRDYSFDVLATAQFDSSHLRLILMEYSPRTSDLGKRVYTAPFYSPRFAPLRELYTTSLAFEHVHLISSIHVAMSLNISTATTLRLISHYAITKTVMC